MRELKGLTVENDVVTSKTIAACAGSMQGWWHIHSEFRVLNDIFWELEV